MDCCDCCACTTAAASANTAQQQQPGNSRQQQQPFKVRSVELRGENQETLEVCLANDESASNEDIDELSASSQLQVCGDDEMSAAVGERISSSRATDGMSPSSPCRHCPPPCNDPHCMACLQQCAHKQYTLIKYNQG